MRICLAQISPHLGNVSKNFDIHFNCIEKAKKNKAEMIVFPELSLTGYTLRDLLPEVALHPAKSPVFKKLRVASRSLDIVLGFVEEKEKGIYFNSAAYLSRGKILRLHRKVFLPTYGMFEEGRFFAQGKNFTSFQTPGGKAGMMICRDFLSYGASYLHFAGGAEIIIIISAAPGRGVGEKEDFATSRMWELMGEAISFFSTAFVIYCNRVGFEDGKVFAGGSFIFDPSGRLLLKAPPLEEKLLYANLRLGDLQEVRKKWPFKRDDRPELILHALERIVRQDED